MSDQIEHHYWVIKGRDGAIIQTVMTLFAGEREKIEAAGYEVLQRTHSLRVWDWVKGEADG